MSDDPYMPPQDWTGGPGWVNGPDPLEEIASSGCSKELQRAFEVIRDTLEDAGIPFPRANALAERCYKALGEVL